MYKQVLDPVGNALGWSSLFAALPLIVLFVLLGGIRMKAQWAALLSLLTAILVALIAYDMPFGQTMDSAAEGALFGFFPIMWIVINAIWVYNMTRETGHFAVLRRSFATVSADERIQAVIIAFSFGALIEALAGFGTPVAISSVMLIALGFRPIKAASVALVANTAPVAFGAIAIPIVTLSEVSGLPKDDLGAMVGRQTPLLAVIVPLILVAMVDGRRGLRQTWPAALVAGVTFGALQFATSNYISVELTDIIASLGSAAAIVLLLQIWQPSEPLLAEEAAGPTRPAVAGAESYNPTLEAETRRRDDQTKDSRRDIILAYAPYVIIIAVFGIAQIGTIKDWLDGLGSEFKWPGLHVLNAKGKEPMSVTFKFNWANAAGSLMLVAGIITMLVLRFSPMRALRTYWATLVQLRWAIVTVMSVLALAYVMNLSGETITLGTWAAEAGSFFAFLSPLIGWFGVAVTGSDTSSNALFGALQVTAAKKAGLEQVLLAAGNSSGGVLGKMISPQNLAIGAAAVGMSGREGDLFRRVLLWSVVLILIMCVLVFLQSKSLLDWMVV
ncbi:MAG: L-lactate permease [Thermoleophilaceae bacterium]